MKRAAVAMLVLAAALGTSGPAAGAGTTLTFQGRLTDASGVLDGAFDLRLILYDAEFGGSQVGSILFRDDVPVSKGLFTVALDFGAVFDGNARFLEVAVRPGSSTGAYSTLGVRKELTPAAIALFSAATGDATVQRRTVPPTCPSGQYLRSLAPDGTPTCALDVDTNSGGTVTSVTAGAGLTGGPITGAGTLAADFAGTGSAPTMARSDHDHDATYQRKIGGACAPGATVRQVNFDGTVVCEDNGTPGPLATTIDSAGSVGTYTSIAIGTDGLGLISYFDGSSLDLKVAHCRDARCTGADTHTLDAPGSVGGHTSITIGTDGLGLISYHDFSNHHLKVAHCNDVGCTSAAGVTLDPVGQTGFNTSITIGADGLGFIAYSDILNSRVKVAHCDNTACSSATLRTIDPTVPAGFDVALTLGADGLPLIAYMDYSNHLKVAHCNDATCSAPILSTIDSGGGSALAITIGTDGLGLVSYTGLSLKTAHCNDLACTSATLATLESTGGLGSQTAVGVGGDGLGLIAYLDGTNAHLKVAHCSNVACSVAVTTTVDASPGVGASAALAIGTDGFGLVCYSDGTNADLKAVHCGNVLCSPYVGRGR
jgi:hypothetical protein